MLAVGLDATTLFSTDGGIQSELPAGSQSPVSATEVSSGVWSAALSTADWGLGPHKLVATLTGGNPS